MKLYTVYGAARGTNNTHQAGPYRDRREAERAATAMVSSGVQRVYIHENVEEDDDDPESE